jgi:hypothetical protein
MTEKPNLSCLGRLKNVTSAFPRNLSGRESLLGNPCDTTPSGTPIIRWDIAWGDGTFDSYNTSFSNISHVYTQAGPAEVQFAAVTLDPTNGYGTYLAPAQSVYVDATGVTATPVNLSATAATDTFDVSTDGNGDTVITQNGSFVLDEPTADILSLSITGGAANVTVDFTTGDPLPLPGIYSDAAAITLTGPHGSDQLITTSTAAYLGSDEIRYPATTTIRDNLSSDAGIVALAGTTNLANPAGDSLTVMTGATALVNGSQTFSSLTIGPGATVRQVSTNTTFGASVLTVGALEIENPDAYGNGGGVLDLGNGDLILEPGDTALISGSSSIGGYIEQLLTAGYDGGLWDGVNPNGGPNPAAIISYAAADDIYGIEALGYATVGTGAGEINVSAYDAVNVQAGDTIVALTYYGDANLDRTVDSTDYALMSYGATLGLNGWGNGDFNYNGQVDAGDGDLIDTTCETMNLGVTTQPFQPRGSTSGGTGIGTPGTIHSANVSGTVTVTGGVTITDVNGNNHSNGISVNLNRSDGQPVLRHCFWIRFITETATDRYGHPINGSYTAGAGIWDPKTNAYVHVTRTYGQSYCDPQATTGVAAFVEPDNSDVASVDTPSGGNVVANGGTVTWTGTEYLVVDGAVVYEVTWTATQSLSANNGAVTYAVTQSTPVDQITGNPKTLTIGNDGNGNPVNIDNLGYKK